MNSTDAFTRLVRELAKFGYLERLTRIGEETGGELWLFGGWVRAAAIGAPGYAGDLDCIVVNPDSTALPEKSTTNFSGGLRIRLDDGNHADITTLYTRNGRDVLDVLRTFDISANAVAFRLSDGAVVARDGSLDDLRNRTLRVGRHDASAVNSRRADVLFAADALMKIDGFTPAADSSTVEALEELRQRQHGFRVGTSQSLLRDGADAVRDLVPRGAASWIVRGYARCATLEETCFWDDIDVVADASLEEIVAYLKRQGVQYVNNFHGNPKVCIPDGRTVDIWSLGGGTILAQLDQFEFNVDCIGVEVASGEVINPLALDAKNRKLLLQRADLECEPYLGAKAIYLCLRHDLIAGDDRTVGSMRQQIDPTGFLAKNIYRLCRELACTGVRDLPARVQRLSGDVGKSPILDRCREILALTANLNVA